MRAYLWQRTTVGQFGVETGTTKGVLYVRSSVAPVRECSAPCQIVFRVKPKSHSHVWLSTGESPVNHRWITQSLIRQVDDVNN